MKKSNKGILSILLCVALVLAMAPITAMAVDASGGGVGSSSGRSSYYGRSALATLSNSTALLYAYDQIVAGVEQAAESISVYNGTNAISADELRTVMDAYRRDYAAHFWRDNGYSYSYNSATVLSVMPEYLMTGTDLEAARENFYAAADSLLSGITDTMTEYEKELYLHDKLAERVEYVKGTNAHNAYGALVEGEAVCEGYAEALQYLLQRAGIQSFIVLGSSIAPSSTTSVGHAWNLVRIDGTYYHTDLTWNDQGENLYHEYFNLSDALIQEDHSIDNSAYALPTCNSLEAQYFTGKTERLETYDVETVGALLRDNDLRVHVYIPGSADDFITWYYENIRQIVAEAGVTGSYSYGYSRLNKELIIRINRKGVSVMTDGVTSVYTSLAKALQNCTAGSTLKLLSDMNETVTVTTDVCIDLNGCDIAGNITAAAGVDVLIRDSQTDDYTVQNGNGYGRITGTATGISPMDGYVMLTESDGVSFHKVDIALETVNLKAGAAGLYYTGSYRYDGVVARNLTACGVTLSTANTAPVADDSDATSLYTTSANSTLLANILSTENTAGINRIYANKTVYGRAYLKLTDGTCLYSDVTGTSLRTVVEAVDDQLWSALTDAQKASLAAMYETYSAAMTTWSIPNLKAYAAG